MNMLKELREHREEIDKRIQEEVKKLEKRYAPFMDRIHSLVGEVVEYRVDCSDNDCIRDKVHDELNDYSPVELLNELEHYEWLADKVNKLKEELVIHDILLEGSE